MHVKAEQLISSLNNKALPIVWISGDETLLVQEACDAVRKYAKKNGYLEREILDVQSGFAWSKLLESANNLSLFAEKKLIDLRLTSAKLDNEARKTLQAYVESPSEDNLLLITSAKIDKAATKAKWFQSIEKHACFVQIWPINAQQLPSWIERRLKHHGLSADRQAIQILCQRVEGNLLAAAQEIEKLTMLTNTTHFDAAAIARAVADSSRYSVFSLVDATLSGNTPRALRIMAHLKAEGSEPLQILNLLCREIRALCRMCEKIATGQPAHAVMQAERVWSNRTAIIGAALNNHTVKSLENILKDAKNIDQSVKGLVHNNPWDEITKLLLKTAKTETCLNS